MPYSALPDRRIPYDNDGSVTGEGTYFSGIYYWPSNAVNLEWQDDDLAWSNGLAVDPGPIAWWCFFPEQREITGIWMIARQDLGGYGYFPSPQGSNDSTNGLDGSWETASLPSGANSLSNVYSWRSNIKPVSFTGPKRVFRAECGSTSRTWYVVAVHLYGEKGAGQTPDDIIYINHDDTPGVEFTAPEDFGDQPLATTVVRQFRIKNVSGSKTANTINMQCNDSDFAISEDGVNWVVTINIASLSAGAESATLYIRSTTPAVGAGIGPRFSRIVTTVASYT